MARYTDYEPLYERISELERENAALKERLDTVKPLVEKIAKGAEQAKSAMALVQQEVISAMGELAALVVSYDNDMRKAKLEGIEMAAVKTDSLENGHYRVIGAEIRKLKETV